MILVSALWYALCIILLFCCIVIAILGAVWLINYELKELTGTDFVRKWIERK